MGRVIKVSRGTRVGVQKFSPKLAARVAEADIESFAEADGRRRLVIDLPYDRVRAVLWAITLGVIALGIFREGRIALYGNDSPLGGLPLINLDSENALGEWWSVLQLTLAAVLVTINGVAEPSRRWKPYWFVLAGMFVFLSCDENVGVHEYVVQWLPTHADFLLFSWIIPYGVICLAIGFFYVPFVLALPRHIRWRVILAGALFIAAAMGMEAVGGHCATIQSQFCWQLEVIAEEGGEMIALTIFILALLALLRSRSRIFAFKI